MAKRSRPAQGNNSSPKPSNKFPKTIRAGGDNVNTGGRRAPRVNKNRKRGFAS